MSSNLDKYKSDLKRLCDLGALLDKALLKKCFSEEDLRKKAKKDFFKDFEKLPNFDSTYQIWYSEAISIVNLLLPHRLDDFIHLYEKSKNRKDITYENYSIEDCLQGLVITRGFEKEVIVGTAAAIPRFRQQLVILNSAKRRFDSSLFDIKQIIQADLYDSECEAAKALNKHGFCRAAGAMAGVVLEKHLAQVCDNHKIHVGMKNPTISDLNQFLKTANIIEIPIWRFIQHLTDLRNLCDHNKKCEPTSSDVLELITGVEKIIKTLF